jgi:polar amino acid transport system substrate-binding protein
MTSGFDEQLERGATFAQAPECNTDAPIGMQQVTGNTSRPLEPHDRTAAHRRAVTRRATLGTLVLPLLPALLGRGARAAAVEPVRIVFDVFENAPLICGNGTAIDPVKPGLTIEMLRMASEHAHVPITLSRTPWQRGLYLIQTGQADAIFASSYVKARTRYGVYPMKDGRADPSRELFQQSYRLYVRAGSGISWDGKTLTNLHGPVGATPGYAVVAFLRAMGVSVDEEPNHIDNLRKLLAGHLDGYAELENHIRPILRANPAEFAGIVELSPPILTKPYYLMFSKIFYTRTPAVAERIWDAIAAVHASRAYQDLLRSKSAGC